MPDHGRQHGEAERREVEREAVGLHPAGQRQQRRHGEIGADGDEGAVAEVEHVHQPEHEREPAGDDEDHHAHGERGDRQRDPGGRVADQRQAAERQHRHQQQRQVVGPHDRNGLGCRRCRRRSVSAMLLASPHAPPVSPAPRSSAGRGLG